VVKVAGGPMMRLLRHEIRWKTSPIGVLPIEPRRMQEKSSGRLVTGN